MVNVKIKTVNGNLDFALDLLDRLLLLCYECAFLRPVTRERQTIRTIALTLELFQLR